MWASSHCVQPQYDPPNVPTLPVDHGSAAVPLHRVVAVLGVPVVGAEEAGLELPVRPVPPPHVLLHHDVAPLSELVPLLHAALAFLGVRRPLQQHGELALRIRPVHIRPQHRPIPHPRPNIRLDHYSKRLLLPATVRHVESPSLPLAHAVVG